MKSNHLLDLFNLAKDYRYLIRMIKDKRYTIPFGRKLVYIVMVLYIIIPFDFIPGIFPLVGIVDDLGAFAVIIGALLYEVTAYRDFLDGVRAPAGSTGADGRKRIDKPNAASDPPGKPEGDR